MVSVLIALEITVKTSTVNQTYHLAILGQLN